MARTVLYSHASKGTSSGLKITVPLSTNGWDEHRNHNYATFGGKGNLITSITVYGITNSTPDP